MNATIVSAGDVEPSTSIWAGILGLVEDTEKDSKEEDVSSYLYYLLILYLMVLEYMYRLFALRC